MFDPWGASHLAGVVFAEGTGGGDAALVTALCAAIASLVGGFTVLGRMAYKGQADRGDRLEKVVLDMLPVMESTRSSNAEVAKSNAAIVVSITELAKVVGQIGDKITELAVTLRERPR